MINRAGEGVRNKKGENRAGNKKGQKAIAKRQDYENKIDF